MQKLAPIATVLVIVGGLNWGLVAIAEFDLVAWIFGEDFGTTNAASRIVYGLVGLAAVYSAFALVARLRSPGPAELRRPRRERGGAATA
jgi:uncharacterized membrane protein YuzA (DUF378 family)